MNNRKIKDRDKLVVTLGKFSTEMRKRLLEKHETGYRGWDLNACKDEMENKLLAKANYIYIPDSDCIKHCIDIANFAMFLWNLEKERLEKLKERG